MPSTTQGSITVTWGPYDGFWHYEQNRLRRVQVAFIGFTYVPGPVVDDFLADLTLEEKP